MKGKHVAALLLLPALAVGASVYYLQVYAFYRPVAAGSPEAMITLTPRDGTVAEPMPMISGFAGIDADSSPLRFRGCFKTAMTLPELTAGYRLYEKPTPLIAPSWFDCFDAGQIDADLETGKAVAFLSQKNITPGVDRVVAVYPDGRAFAWPQLNESAEQ